MSLIIKGIDMPKSGSIVVEILPNGKVFPHTKGISFHHEAIQIPTPHGRLIDADQITLECQWCSLDEAPTIIEAER